MPHPLWRRILRSRPARALAARARCLCASLAITRGAHPACLPLAAAPPDTLLAFTKERCAVLACGGAHGGFARGARSLLVPAIESPVAGVVHGLLDGRPWSAFAWELVEIADGEARKTLVLHSLKAAGRVSPAAGAALCARLRALPGYRGIACGARGNAIELASCADDERERQSVLPGYAHAWPTGDGDDSRWLRTIAEFPRDRHVQLRRMDAGDLVRCKYLEQAVYARPDPAFLTIDVTASPCYVFDSSTNLYGYFVTRLKYYPRGVDHGYAQHADVRGWALRHWRQRHRGHGDPHAGLEPVLYLEDLVILPYRACLFAFGQLHDDLLHWMHMAGVNTLVANFNDCSRPFVKRLERMGCRVVCQHGLGAYESALPPVCKAAEPEGPVAVRL